MVHKDKIIHENDNRDRYNPIIQYVKTIYVGGVLLNKINILVTIVQFINLLTLYTYN